MSGSKAIECHAHHRFPDSVRGVDEYALEAGIEFTCDCGDALIPELSKERRGPVVFVIPKLPVADKGCANGRASGGGTDC
jgi:hypothetical protein